MPVKGGRLGRKSLKLQCGSPSAWEQCSPGHRRCGDWGLSLLLFFREGKEERERNTNVWLPPTCPLVGNLACTPGMCPDWDSNQLPFDAQASSQPLAGFFLFQNTLLSYSWHAINCIYLEHSFLGVGLCTLT